MIGLIACLEISALHHIQSAYGSILHLPQSDLRVDETRLALLHCLESSHHNLAPRELILEKLPSSEAASLQGNGSMLLDRIHRRESD